MRTQFPRIIVVVGLVLHLSCTNIQSTINRKEAATTPLDCALYAAQITNRPEAIAKIAIRYAEAGDFKRAVNLIESIEERAAIEFLRGEFYFRRVYEHNVSSKITGFVKIALLQAKAKYPDQALKSLERAVSLANLFEKDLGLTREAQLTQVIAGFILIGKEERGFSIYYSLPDTPPNTDLLRRKTQILTAIAESLVKTGNITRGLETLTQAEDLLTQIHPPYVFSDGVIKVANIYSQLGMTAKAVSLIQDFAKIEKDGLEKYSDSSPWVLLEFAEKLAELGKPQEGIKLAVSINASEAQALTIANIAKLLAKSKKYDLALDLLKKIPTDEVKYQDSAQEEIAKLFLDEGNFDKAFEIMHESKNINSQAVIASYAAQKYSELGNLVKAREVAISTFELGMEKLNEKAFVACAVQNLLLTDKNLIMQKIKERGTIRGTGFELCEIAEKLAETNQDMIAIEVLKFIHVEDYIDDAGPITIRDYRSSAIEKITLRYYDTKRPDDANLQAILAEFVKLLD